MKKGKNQFFSIYLKKSISKAKIILSANENKNRIAVKKLLNNNITVQSFYKPITRTIRIGTEVS